MLALPLLLAVMPIAPPYVEIDFTRTPFQSDHDIWIVYTVFAVDGELGQACHGHEYVAELAEITEFVAEGMTDQNGLKTKVVDGGKKIRVYGEMDKAGKVVRRAVYAEVYTRGLDSSEIPKVKNPPPPPVEFDLRPIPLTPGHPIRLTFETVAADRSRSFRTQLQYEKLGRRSDLSRDLVDRLTQAGLKATAEGDTVRVNGWPDQEGKVRPAVGGKVTAEGLTPDQRPQVRGVPGPAPCVTFDLRPLAGATGRKVKLVYEAGPAEDGKPFRGEQLFDELFPPEDLAAVLFHQFVRAGFRAERENATLRVYGWADQKMKFHPTTTGRMDSQDIKPAERPQVVCPKTGL